METRVAIVVAGPLLEGKSAAVVQRNAEAAVTEATFYLWPRIQAATPTDTTTLQRSIQAEIQGKGTAVVKGVVSTAQRHGLVTEEGRSPGKPVPKDLDLSGWISRRFGVSIEEAKKLNFVVKRAIARKGTIKRFDYHGAGMFGGTLQKEMPALQAIFQRYGFAIATELNNG